jgi:hypothetical protein
MVAILSEVVTENFFPNFSLPEIEEYMNVIVFEL